MYSDNDFMILESDRCDHPQVKLVLSHGGMKNINLNGDS